VISGSSFSGIAKIECEINFREGPSASDATRFLSNEVRNIEVNPVAKISIDKWPTIWSECDKHKGPAQFGRRGPSDLET